jgi:putative transposase
VYWPPLLVAAEAGPETVRVTPSAMAPRIVPEMKFLLMSVEMKSTPGTSAAAIAISNLTPSENYANLNDVKSRRQLAFEFPKRGGLRPGAGRPRLHERPGLVGPGVAHVKRETFASRRAVHVTQRLRPDAGYLRKQGPAQVILQAFRDAAERGGIRIAHYSIQGNHLHLVVEAENARALARGIQGLTVRIARRLNRRIGRSGPVFADRYHSHVLVTRREVANAIRYVTGNYRHHAREHLAPRFRDPLATQPMEPLAKPKLWLLGIGWQSEPPGPSRAAHSQLRALGLPFRRNRKSRDSPVMCSAASRR